ncbi:hypothetical protein ACLBKU_17440 [Erythrobacter sp. NE805]|uniref:hypothetical protein n=1 Tax=Erythrobacter sp. NE805 TaxID=3389875 RepID=UPI00396AFB7D
MSWWEGLHLALSIAMLIGVFIIGDDEPFWVRLGSAVFVAVFWLPLLVIFAIWMIGDGIGGLVRMLRR